MRSSPSSLGTYSRDARSVARHVAATGISTSQGFLRKWGTMQFDVLLKDKTDS